MLISELLQQFHDFSRKNIWVFFLLLLALSLVFFTGKGNILEISIIFFLQLIANLYMMLMQDSYKDSRFHIGAIYLFAANMIFTGVALYGFFINNEYQYLLWQISFNLSGLQNLLRYTFHKKVVFVHYYFLLILGLSIISILFWYFQISYYGLIQSFGFLCVTSGIVLQNDIKRYFQLFVGTFFIVLGSFLGLYVNYLDGNVLGITLGYGLLSLTVLLYYMRIFPIYIRRINLK